MIEIKPEQINEWIKQKKVRAKYGDFEADKLLSLFNDMQDPKKQENLDLSAVSQKKVLAMRMMRNDIIKCLKSKSQNRRKTPGQEPPSR